MFSLRHGVAAGCLAFALGSACGGDQPAGAADAGQPAVAFAKFCNLLDPEGAPFELSLEFGQPPVRLTASTGACAPAARAPCAGFPAGAVAIALRARGNALAVSAAEVQAGQSWLFVVRKNATTGSDQLVGRPLPGDVACADVTEAYARTLPDAQGSPL